MTRMTRGKVKAPPPPPVKCFVIPDRYTERRQVFFDTERDKLSLRSYERDIAAFERIARN